jgi:DNA primase
MARGQIPDGFVHDVIARTDIVEVVGRHVELRKGGANLLGLCPFHGEKSPSFTVSPSKQFYHCFGCGAHGDVLRFLMEHTGVGFREGLEDLAQRLGLQLPETEVDPRQAALEAQSRAQRQTLTSVLDRAAEHYRQRLRESRRAIDYLKRRGLSGPVARDFGLGYAPEGWRSLASAFARYDAPELADAGLVIVQDGQAEDTRRYDRFRDRIMFPIRSVKGEIIGFGGRVLDLGEPKYLNSPETPVFVKGRELYGLFEARNGIREQGHVLVVEGYMDVVALAQYGIDNAVATLGTACTADHVQKLLRFTDHVVFSFDGDAAGRRAAGRALEAALPHLTDLRSFRFLFLPAEHDPDSYVRAHGKEAFGALARAALPLSRQLLEHAAEGQALDTAEARARMLARARPLWQQMPASAMRMQIMAELAQAARMSMDELARLWGDRRPDSRSSQAARRPVGGAGPVVRRVRQPPDHVARMLLRNASLWHALTEADHELLTRLASWHGALFRWLERELTEHGPREWPELREGLDPQPFGARARDLVDGDELSIAPDLEELRGALSQTARALALEEPLHLLGRVG